MEGNGSFIELSWLITIRYDEEEEKLELQWHPKILPYISDLRDYCSLALAVVGRIKGQYSLRLYERIRLQCKYSQKPGKIYLPLNEFRWELGLSDEYYKEFKYLKRDLLVPAIRELKKHHAVYTDIQPVREGRLTTGIWLYYMFLSEEEWGMYENGAVVDVVDSVDGKLKKVSNGQDGGRSRSFISG